MTTSVNAVDQFQKLLEIAKAKFQPDRFSKLEKMYEHFADRIVVAPASAKLGHHCCYPGGYLDHVHNVILAIMHITKVASAIGMTIDFTSEEAIFVAMHHDLGKLGDLNEPYYIPQPSNWHKENKGALYIHNPKLPRSSVVDRSLMILQHFGIVLTPKEWVAIKTSDGLYVESNKPYFVDYDFPAKPTYTNLVYILHWADHMATCAERNKAGALS
jgi:hypothetical protein